MSFQRMCDPVIIVHGGAGIHATIADDGYDRHLVEDGMKLAARQGYDVLSKNGCALDAVEAAVCVLEDDPIFNAGKSQQFEINYLIKV